jgi:endonuclease/exonuclease/phosphatase family protein
MLERTGLPLRWRMVPLAAALLLGCGASSFANLAGFAVTERDAASSWTQAAAAEARAPGEERTPALEAVAATSSGQFLLLTYNVAGLPQLVSPSHPRVNIPIVSSLLNRYDVALVQEDFSYHQELIGAARHAYRSVPMQPHSFVGDGLSQFSRLPFGPLHRVRWARCNGFVSSSTDCLADKGFSFSELSLAPGVVVHLYNLHADAGPGELDVETRAQNFEQLAAHIATVSRAAALIVAGDTNLRAADPGDAATLARFLRAAHLTDSCPVLRCGGDVIDRVMLRSSPGLTLAVARSWHDGRFVDARGQGLSDHPAVGVEIAWQRVESSQLVAHAGVVERP